MSRRSIVRTQADYQRMCAADGHRTVPANWAPDGSPIRNHCAFCGETAVLRSHECTSGDWLERHK